MIPQNYYRIWYLNFWVIILLLLTLLIFFWGLLEVGVFFLVITGLVIANVQKSNKKYNQRILAFCISDTTSKRKGLDALTKAFIELSVSQFFRFKKKDNEHWSQDVYRKYWPQNIPEGLHEIYESAQYWSDEDIAKSAIKDWELLFAKKTRKDAKQFLSELKENKKRDYEEKREWAKLTGENVFDIINSERENEQKEINEEKRRRIEEEDRINKNVSNIAFTAVTGRCPSCFKKISLLANKCPYCTADLRT